MKYTLIIEVTLEEESIINSILQMRLLRHKEKQLTFSRSHNPKVAESGLESGSLIMQIASFGSSI